MTARRKENIIRRPGEIYNAKSASLNLLKPASPQFDISNRPTPARDPEVTAIIKLAGSDSDRAAQADPVRATRSYLRKTRRQLESLALLVSNLSTSNPIPIPIPLDVQTSLTGHLTEFTKVVCQYKCLEKNKKRTKPGPNPGSGSTKVGAASKEADHLEAGTGAGARPRVAKEAFKLREEHIEVLKYLAIYKFATTNHFTTYFQVERASYRLRELEKAGLIRSYRYEIERGRASEKCWWLWYGGAKLLNSRFPGQKVRYEPRFATHPPSPDRIKLRDMELELVNQIEQASALIAGAINPGEVRGGPGPDAWQLICPQEFNSVHRKDPQTPTPQCSQLAAALDRIERREIKEMQRKGYQQNQRLQAMQAEEHLDCIPFHANQHLAYVANTELAVVLILCPLDATDKFWEVRSYEYAKLAERIKVFGVFHDKYHATAWLEAINKAGIGVVTIDKVAELLRDMVN